MAFINRLPTDNIHHYGVFVLWGFYPKRKPGFAGFNDKGFFIFRFFFFSRAGRETTDVQSYPPQTWKLRWQGDASEEEGGWTGGGGDRLVFELVTAV